MQVFIALIFRPLVFPFRGGRMRALRSECKISENFKIFPSTDFSSL